MKSAPHLFAEDRPEFERVLDEVLRTADRQPDLKGIGQRLTAEQLRTMALSASAAITACAAAEYQDYVVARTRLREPAPPPPLPMPGAPEDDGEHPHSAGFTGAVLDASGAGLVPMLAVLAPVLAGTAAIIFLLVGYVLHVLDPAPSIAQPMITAGWFFAALTAAGILLAGVGLLITALRNGSSAIRGEALAEQLEEVDRAREAWRQALLERGVLPFLREALTNPSAPAPWTAPTRSSSAYVPGYSEAGRTPHLGYSRPGFSTDDEAPKARPRYSSPDYTSPEYGGPENQPD